MMVSACSGRIQEAKPHKRGSYRANDYAACHFSELLGPKVSVIGDGRRKSEFQDCVNAQRPLIAACELVEWQRSVSQRPVVTDFWPD
jgi:hypothetical protein